MVESKIEQITKRDAARRQLATAIELFFNDGDTVSIHTLTSAAYEVLRDLGKKGGIYSSIKDSPYIKPKKQKEAIKIFNKDQNFFKHANTDAEAVLDFHPDTTPLIIIDAIDLYIRLTGSIFDEAKIFLLWSILKYPNIILGPSQALRKEARESGIDPEDIDTIRLTLAKLKKKS
jgi:hypothetical protein